VQHNLLSLTKGGSYVSCMRSDDDGAFGRKHGRHGRNRGRHYKMGKTSKIISPRQVSCDSPSNFAQVLE
jgi:hypothetical protein